MITVRHLPKKGLDYPHHSSGRTVFDAVAKMAEQDIGSLVVMDGEKLVGIVSERHYARNVALKGKTSPEMPVRDITDRRVACVQPEQTRRATHGSHERQARAPSASA